MISPRLFLLASWDTSSIQHSGDEKSYENSTVMLEYKGEKGELWSRVGKGGMRSSEWKEESNVALTENNDNEKWEKVDVAYKESFKMERVKKEEGTEQNRIAGKGREGETRAYLQYTDNSASSSVFLTLHQVKH